MPQALVTAHHRDPRPERLSWLAALPDTVRDVEDRWDLELGPPFQPGGQTAWVAPARTSDGRELVLKLGWRHTESWHEAEGLRAWAGDGAVRLYDELIVAETTALLLERCRPGRALSEEPATTRDSVVAGLIRRLDVVPPADHPFRSLQDLCDFWISEYERPPVDLLDAAIVDAGLTLLGELPGSAPQQVLLCTDLHGDNVLAAEREPWLMIDPKPYVGDPTFEPVQYLLNCEERLHSDPVGLVQAMAARCDLEPGRLRLWLFARCVQEAPEWLGLGEVARRLAP
jgi:streptomycin 6-kinase